MSLSATYEGTLSSVALSAGSLGGSATNALFERSLNESLWMPVRGGLQRPVVSGESTVNDHEFFSDVTNHYRVTSYNSAGVQQAQHTTSIVPSLSGRVWLKSIKYPGLNRAVHVMNWTEITRASRSTASAIVGRSLPAGSHDMHGGHQFTLTLVTGDMYDPDVDGAAEAAVWDLSIAMGGVHFIHVPNGQPVPGGYVALGQTSWDRTVRHGRTPNTLELPCTLEVPPSPQVTGTLLTWSAIRNVFGDSWEAVWAAHQSWHTLLSTVAHPDDLVVW